MAHGQKMNKILWLMDKKMNIDFFFEQNFVAHGQKMNNEFFLFEQNFVVHGQKMKIDCSFLNKTLWLMDKK